MSETAKRFPARHQSGWFLKYTQNLGIDIGSGIDPVTLEVEKWDKELGNTDATFMAGVPDNHFDYVYSYHCLEHLNDPVTAIRNWYRILKPGGWLIIGVPHRNLYEKNTLLPSRWNLDHKTFWLPLHDEPPFTLGLLDTVMKALGPIELQSLVVFDDGCLNTDKPMEHAMGEYTIEIIVRKTA
jgi:SAM-dependent methyltransferase